MRTKGADASWRIRLVACLTWSLPVMNAHAALGLCAPGPIRATPTARSSTTEPPKTKSHCCKRCATKHVQRASVPALQSSKPDRPCDDSCPGCPKGPGGKPCHVPGGCILCSVAKVPCLIDLTPSQDAGPCLGATVADLPILYISPSSGGLIRPPRA